MDLMLSLGSLLSLFFLLPADFFWSKSGFIMILNNRISASVIVIILFCGLSVFAGEGVLFSGPDTLNSDPCPAADRIDQLNFNKKILYIPKSKDQVRDLLEKISSSNQNEAARAIVSLALAGNLKAFTKLLNSQNANGLSLYCSYYQNANEKKCIDPVLEAAVIEYLDDPKTGEPLLQLFRKNYYQSRVLFEKLINMDPEAGNVRKFELIVNALVASNLPGTEQQILEHGLTNAAHIDRKFWWAVSSVDKHYVDFFTRRNFKPGIQYIQEILDADHYSKVPENYKVHLLNRQNVLYYKLEVFPSSKTGDIFINQLSKLVDIPWDMLFNVEFEAVGRRSIKHAQSMAQRKQIVDHLAKIIKTGNRLGYDVCGEKARSKDSFNIKVRSRLIQFLAQAATDEAATVLLQEFQGLVERKDCRYATNLISQLVIALNTLPESVSLNVPEFLQAVLKFEHRERYLTVPLILKKHPHPEGHKYLLSLLEEIIAKKDGLKFLFGMDLKGSFNWMLEILLAFDKPEYLFETRKKVGSFHQGKRLEDEIYISTSKRLNALIGNEFPVYVALRKQKEEEERERKRQLAIQERTAYTASYGERIVENLSTEGIKKNVAQLSFDGFAEKRAASWLVLAGPEALPYMHAALLDTTSTAKFKYKLISMLGVIGDQSSIQPVLKTMLADPKFIHKGVFLSLSHMPVTDEAFSFVEKQLINSNSNKVKQSALIYFALEKESRAKKLIGQYSDTTDPGLRLAALYLAARLHDQRAKDSIIALLLDNPDRSNQGLLLRSLAELVSPDEFQEAIKKSEINPTSKKYYEALWLSEYRNATRAKKAEAAKKLLQSEYLWDRREAVQYLIGQNRADILEPFLFADPRVELPYMAEVQGSHVEQLIVLEAKKMGYLLEETDGGIRLSKE